MVISAACAGVLLHAARATTNVIVTTSVRFMTSSEVCRILSRTARLEKFFDPGTLLFAHRFRLFRSMSNARGRRFETAVRRPCQDREAGFGRRAWRWTV